MAYNIYNTGRLRGGSSSAAVIPMTGKSVGLTAASSQYLSRTNAAWGAYNRQKFSIVFWVLPTNLSVARTLFGKGDGLFGTGDEFECQLTTSGGINFTLGIGAVFARYNTAASLVTAGVYNHIKIDVDTTQATAGNRMKVTINGTRDSAPAVEVQPSLNDTVNSTAGAIIVGARGDATAFAQGNIFQWTFFSGTTPALASFYDAAATQKPMMIDNTIPGMYSWIDCNAAVTTDGKLAGAWTNNNTAVLSSTIPVLAGNWV